MKIPIAFELDVGEYDDLAGWIRRQAAERVADAVREQLEREIKHHLPTLITDAAKEIIQVQLQRLLSEGLERFDSWGKKTGEKLTLQSVIAEILTKKVGHGYGSDRKESTILEDMIREEIATEMKTEFKEVYDKAKESFRAAVDSVAKKKLQLILTDALGLR